MMSHHNCTWPLRFRRWIALWLFLLSSAAHVGLQLANASDCIPFPEDLNNAGRVRRKTRYLGAVNTTLPVIYLNADERKNEDLMMRHLLEGAPTILGEDNHPDENLAWPTKFERISVPPVQSDGIDHDCHVTAVCADVADQARAHVAAWNLAAQYFAGPDPPPAVLILEDDVMALLPGIWEHTLEQLVVKATEEMPDWCVLRLSLTTVNQPYRQEIINGWKKQFGKALLPIPKGAIGKGGAAAYLVRREGLQELRQSCPSQRLCITDLAGSFFAPLAEGRVGLRAVQMFTWNPVASDRSMQRVLSTLEGKMKYIDFVTVAQQNVENSVARSPAPANITEMLPLWNDVWRPRFS